MHTLDISTGRLRVGVAVTRAAAVEPTWSTAILAERLLAEGHELRFIEPWDFEVDRRGRTVARAHALDAPMDRAALCGALADRSARRCYVELGALDLLLLRANPLDTAIMTFAMQAEAAGVVVLNPPAAVLRTSHKGFVATLPGVARPATMVSRSRSALHAFASEFREGVVVKPARSSGGRGVSWVQQGQGADLDRALDQARALGDGYTVVQEYLPAAEDGEKRLVWLDGRLLGGYLRRRAEGEFRHNLRRGAQPEPTEVTEQDQAIVHAVTPTLLEEGIWMAGIDVIGDRIVEVNTLNPGGLHHTQQFDRCDAAGLVLRSLKARLAASRSEKAGA